MIPDQCTAHVLCLMAPLLSSSRRLVEYWVHLQGSHLAGIDDKSPGCDDNKGKDLLKRKDYLSGQKCFKGGLVSTCYTDTLRNASRFNMWIIKNVNFLTLRHVRQNKKVH